MVDATDLIKEIRWDLQPSQGTAALAIRTCRALDRSGSDRAGRVSALFAGEQYNIIASDLKALLIW